MPGLTPDDARRVDDVWGKFAEGEHTGECFLEIEYVVEVYLKRRYAGRRDYVEVAREIAGRPLDRVLVLGCGAGAVQRALIERGHARAVLGIDVSARAIAHAREQARKLGLSGLDYLVADLNDPPAGLGRFDAVFFPASLHHISELERLMDWTHERLAPDGLLVVNEYVGPSRFQWTEGQKREAAAVLPLIPPHFRRLPGGGTKEAIWAPTAEEVAALDPTEAVRSEEILDLVARRFHVARREDLGGGLMFPVLHGIARNFNHEDYHSLVLLQFLLHLDDLLLRAGLVPNCVSDVFARP